MLSRDPQRFLDRMPHLAGRSEFKWLRGNPANFSFPDEQHDYLLHMATATSAHLGQTDPVKMLQSKLVSISHVLDYARYAGIRRMLVTSSGAIYGPQPAELSQIPETYVGAPDPTDPASAYGNGKRMVEQMCALAPEVETVIARCFSFIGPHLPLDGRFAAGNFLRDAVDGKSITIHGDGRAVRSYLHAADLTIWLLTLLLNGKDGRAYNVGGAEMVTIGELARLVSASCQQRPEVALPNSRNAASPNLYVPDVTRAASELGLRPIIGLEEAVTRTIAWMESVELK